MSTLIPKALVNYTIDEYIDENGKARQRFIGIQADIIFEQLKKHVGDWPKCVGGVLYVVNKWGEIERRKSTSEIFGWIAGKSITVDWKPNVEGAISKDDFYQYLRMNASRYKAIETLPHHPPIKSVFYVDMPKPQGIYQGSLTTLLRKFSPDTSNDMTYLKAMFLTPMWGGRCGARPAFVLLGPEDDPEGGSGVGKTTVTDALGLLYGRTIDFESKDTREQITGRLLTSKGSRIIRIDNVKSKMGTETIESLITTTAINGHMMYEGDHVIPNLFTWIITFNMPEFTKDMSQRAIPIRLKRPKHNPGWWANVADYIEENRIRIIYDIIRILSDKSKVEMADSIRFSEWSAEVLSKCTTNENITHDIRVRQKLVESEQPIIDQIYDILVSELDKYQFGPNCLQTDLEGSCYRVRKSLFCQWVCNEIKFMTPNRVSKVLRRDRPEWLNLPENRKKSGESQSEQISHIRRGIHYFEVGSKNTPMVYVLDQNSKNYTHVSKTVRRGDLSLC